jgi:hypothetical protein
MKKSLRLMTLCGLFLASNLVANTDPTTAKLNIYGVAVSTNTDCSDATVVGYTAAGTLYDFLASPTLATGTIAAGTYQCVILYMDAKLTFKPLATVGSCTAATEYSINIANGGVTLATATTSGTALTYGTEVAATGTGSTDLVHVDKVLLFLSTASTGDGQTGDAFRRPVTGHLGYGITLASPLVVAATGGKGTFVVNFDGQVNGSGGTCDLGPPTFAFR